MKIIITENKIDSMIQKYGIVNTIKVLGGYKNFDKLYPDYFYSDGVNRDNVIDYINECVELNYRREGESTIYLYDYFSDILYQEWGGEGDENNEFYSFESRLNGVSTDMVHGEVWQYDDEGNMFDDAYDSFDIPLNRLDSKFLFKIFHMLYGTFKL